MKNNAQTAVEFPIDRAALLQEIIGFAETDLLCYHAPNDAPHTTELFAQQTLLFDPVLQWVAQTYGAEFLTTESVLPIAQNAAAIAALKNEFAAARDHELLALAQLVALFGSALLTLAVWKGFLPVARAIACAQLDEQCQANRYGLDPVIEAKWKSMEVIVHDCMTRLRAA